MRWSGIAAQILLVAGTPVFAADALVPGGTARVSEIVDGDTLVLDDGRRVRLAGIQAPKLPPGPAGVKPGPLGSEAKSALAELTLGRTVRLSFGGRRADRYDRRLAHLHDEDGRWVQGNLLRRGLARVFSLRDNRSLVADMLALEREARRADRGIWGHAFYRVRSASEAPRHLDSFQLVEGRVLDATEVRGRTYLNFGEDWRTDFTVTVSPKDRRRFREESVDLLALEGRRVRVRGWLYRRNGPMIDVTHPEQVELLAE